MSDDAIIFVFVGAAGLALAVLYPEWFRKKAEKTRPRLVEKHEDYVSGIRAQFGDSQPFTVEESWDLIREAVTFRARVSTAIFSIFVMAVPVLYPLYAEAVSGPNIPYWKGLLLGISFGLMFAIIFRICSNVAFRIRIRQLVEKAK